MNEAKERLAKWLDNAHVRKIIFIVGALGIALLFLSNFIHLDKPGSTQTGESAAAYGSQTESDLEDLLSHIQGVGKTRVLLTMENSVESVYLDNGTTKTKEIEPRIRGVLVLCEGGDNPVAVARVSEAVTKALDISSAKVCISKLSE